MADFPAAIYEQRELENVSGQTYDATKKTRVYAEDLVQLGDEITAIENFIGVNGDNLPSGGGTIAVVNPSESADGVRVDFTFASRPLYISVNGLNFFEGDGYTVSGSGPYTITFDTPPTQTPVEIHT